MAAESSSLHLHGFSVLETAVPWLPVDTVEEYVKHLDVRHVVAGVVSGMCGVFVGHPLDTVKARIAFSPASSSGPPLYTGVLDCVGKTWAKEGIRGFFRGLPFPILGDSLVCMSSYGIYGNVRDVLLSRESAGWSDHHIAFVSGAVAGLGSAFVETPFDMLKTQMQVAHTRVLEKRLHLPSLPVQGSLGYGYAYAYALESKRDNEKATIAQQQQQQSVKGGSASASGAPRRSFLSFLTPWREAAKGASPMSMTSYAHMKYNEVLNWRYMAAHPAYSVEMPDHASANAAGFSGGASGWSAEGQGGGGQQQPRKTRQRATSQFSKLASSLGKAPASPNGVGLGELNGSGAVQGPSPLSGRTPLTVSGSCPDLAARRESGASLCTLAGNRRTVSAVSSRYSSLIGHALSVAGGVRSPVGVVGGALRERVLSLTKASVQLSTTTTAAVAKAPSDFDSFAGIRDCLSKVRGTRALYTGLLPVICRNVPGFAVSYTSFEALKRWLWALEGYASGMGKEQVEERLGWGCEEGERLEPRPSVPSLMLAGGLSGCAYWSIAFPMDCLRANMQGQRLSSLAAKRSGDSRQTQSVQYYKGMIDCAQRLYRQAGIRRFYWGLQAAILRAFPANAVVFAVYSSVAAAPLWRQRGAAWDPDSCPYALISLTLSATFPFQRQQRHVRR
uniref:Mitochondrial carrier protein n=1 Tax=Chromera velia CCMP2878 TaxID=1169474 RepID=A0A0G4H133_9ALVE|eukprot:Cvel_795.t1-p1 / transcript=Cvel_795.t1 / gene=Cvel_795 / organism=Chromera_velia_CCMP2878 / gene_product=Mitochondrial substrate carrier family protein G, putative / transcript_product=Mitochondrial substrate carrier family protein G, putative / location=Cvel_scaffold25:417-3757(+) / protein_length=672 / sequence_SO=supercontig / SO=protein_coding / is_pseudo=false